MILGNWFWGPFVEADHFLVNSGEVRPLPKESRDQWGRDPVTKSCVSSTRTAQLNATHAANLAFRPFRGVHCREFAMLCSIRAESGAAPRRSHGETCSPRRRRTKLSSDGDSIDVEEAMWRAPRRCHRVILLLGTASVDGKIPSPRRDGHYRPCCENLTLIPLVGLTNPATLETHNQGRGVGEAPPPHSPFPLLFLFLTSLFPDV